MGGGLIGNAGVRALGANRTAHPGPKSDGRLIVHRAFRIVRHLLYASLVLASVGWSLIWVSGPAAGATNNRRGFPAVWENDDALEELIKMK